MTVNTLTSKMVIISVLLIVVVVSGFVLSRLGRPLNTGVFTIHKLSAIAAIVLLVININKLVKAGDIQSLTIVLIVVTGVLFVAMVVSGGFLSFEKSLPQLALRIHQITPLLAVATAAISLISLIRSQV